MHIRMLNDLEEFILLENLFSNSLVFACAYATHSLITIVAYNVFRLKLDLLQCVLVLVLVLMKNRISIISVLKHAMSFTFMLLPEQLVGKTVFYFFIFFYLTKCCCWLVCWLCCLSCSSDFPC